ncbi:unnamed protein product [Caenorhabditis sp. 36 PRJEB53466]|nr:unnamed protein product [Caenorhabditis sp. 36 PRJEB53466]
MPTKRARRVYEADRTSVSPRETFSKGTDDGRFLNSHICLVIAMLQLLVCCWAVAQHVNSYLMHSKILKCDFLEGSLPLEAVDAVIFDIRLFHYLWGIRGCVAEYLDGGFGRLLWCVSHCLTLIFSIPVTFLSHPRPYLFWPLLFQQSAYGICLLVLLLAALPRIVIVLAAPQAAPLVPILFYFLGTALNFFHLYVYWHWYWHVTAMWNSVVRVKFGERLVNANNRSRRDKPMVPKEEIDEAILHYVPGERPPDQNHVDARPPKVIIPPNPSQPVRSPPQSPPQSNRNRRRRHSSPEVPKQTSCRKLLPNQSSSSRPRVYLSEEEDDDETDGGDEADVDELPSPPPPIYATRLTADSWENRRLRAPGRRHLPQTPDLPKHGELPVLFNIAHANV